MYNVVLSNKSPDVYVVAAGCCFEPDTATSEYILKIKLKIKEGRLAKDFRQLCNFLNKSIISQLHGHFRPLKIIVK